MASNLAIELGFDWNVNPIQGVRDGVFPLQMCLVDDGGAPSQVISPFDPTKFQVGDTLKFRVYNFSATNLSNGPVPSVLQILFTSATASPNDPFSPLDVDGLGRAQLAATAAGFSTTSVPSVAFNTTMGWDVTGSDISELTITQGGRFNFRALLTVGIPGQQARFYRVDPEMVIGDPGDGP